MKKSTYSSHQFQIAFALAAACAWAPSGDGDTTAEEAISTRRSPGAAVHYPPAPPAVASLWLLISHRWFKEKVVLSRQHVCSRHTAACRGSPRSVSNRYVSTTRSPPPALCSSFSTRSEVAADMHTCGLLNKYSGKSKYKHAAILLPLLKLRMFNTGARSINNADSTT